MRTTTRVITGLAVAAAIAGCSGEQDPTLPDPLPTDVPYGYHTVLVPGNDGALLEGTLAEQDGCLVVLPLGGGDPVVPIVPIAATSWDGETFTVNDVVAPVGDPIGFGGGYRTEASEDWYLPSSCPTGGEEQYFVVGLE